MATLNNTTTIGYLGKDPIITETKSKSKVCRFTIAVEDNYLDKNTNAWVNNTHWLPIVAWGKNAEKMAKFKVGDKLSVEGKLSTRTYQHKDGHTVYDLFINPSKIILDVAGSHHDQKSIDDQPVPQNETKDLDLAPITPSDLDDLPF